MAYAAPPFDPNAPPEPQWLPGSLGSPDGFGAPDDGAIDVSNSAPDIADPNAIAPNPYESTDDLAPESDPTGLLAKVESALSLHLEQDLNDSIAMHQPRKYEVAKFKQQLDGQGLADDPTDSLVALGCNLPLAAHKIDILKANILKEISPNAADGIAFDITGQVKGLDPYAKKASTGLKRKVQSCTPAAADSMYDLNNMWLTDFLACGVCLASIGHEGVADDANRDGIRQGPVPQYWDFMNWWSNAYDVNRAAQCDHYLYAPITRYQFVASKFENEDMALKQCTPSANTRRDVNSFDQYLYNNNFLWWQYTNERLYRRYIYIGKFPGEDLRDCAGLADIPDEEMIIALATKYGAADPEAYIEAASETYWWHMEFCDGVLLRVQPYPLEVPAGSCPLIMQSCFKRNGLLMAYGVFDRGGSWSDRLANFFYRAKVHITKSCMNPPWYYRKGMIETAFMQQQGTQALSLVEGMGYPITSNDAVKPIETVLFNAEAIPIAEQARSTHENDLSDLTGSTDALQGDSSANTATQDQNNLQQSNTFASFYSTRFGMFLLSVLKGMYVVWIQSMEQGDLDMPATGYSEYAPADLDDQGLALVQIRRADLLPLEFLEFTLTGPSAPGNRMNQATIVSGQVQLVNTLWPGLMNGPKTAEALFVLSGTDAILSGCLNAPDVFAMIQGMQNQQKLLGVAGAQATGDPMQQAQLASMMQPQQVAPRMGSNGNGGGKGLLPAGGGGNMPTSRGPGNMGTGGMAGT